MKTLLRKRLENDLKRQIEAFYVQYVENNEFSCLKNVLDCIMQMINYDKNKNEETR